MSVIRCCVGGCDSTNKNCQLFSFPRNDRLRSLWMSFVIPTNPTLLTLTKHSLVNKRVCRKHFDFEQFDQCGRRLHFSYPCLFTEKEMLHGVPLTKDDHTVLSEHNYFCHQDQELDISEELLTSGLGDTLQEHSYCVPDASQIEVVTTEQLHQGDVSMADKVISLPTTSQIVVAPVPLGASVRAIHKKPTAEIIIQPTSTRKDSQKQKSSKSRRYIKKCKEIATESIGGSSTQRLQKAQNLTLVENMELLKNFESLNKKAKSFLLMQLRLVRKDKMARRFSLDEKLLALSIMKNSPKSYKLLETIFALPNKRTLSRVAEKVVFDTGLNDNIFEHITKTVKKWDVTKKLCSIVFDEVALTPNLTFDEKKDQINGFVEIAGERRPSYADHALVFMIRGICSSWRQSIAYYFCEGTVSAAELERILKELIPRLSNTGLIPLALVCDQGSTFRSCIKSLQMKTKVLKYGEKGEHDGTVHIAGNDLFVFHDSPHLLKSVRNNFLDKDIFYNGKIATWKDIQYIYELDSIAGHTRAIPKLTAHHVDPAHIKKMQVKAAAQVLSARTAAMLDFTYAIHQRLNSPKESLKTTAEVVTLFDELFDSVNGSPGATRGKLRCAVKPGSEHQEFWRKCVREIKDIRYIDRNSKLAKHTGQPRYVRVPCLEGWITTLQSFMGLANLLFTEYKVKYFYPRYINQDPLENFFGRVRAINYRNNNPDANCFINTFKSLTISSILSPHSKFSNCEEDEGDTIIDFNHIFFGTNDQENMAPNSSIKAPSPSLQPSLPSLQAHTSTTVAPGPPIVTERVRVQISAYTAGYVCRKISRKNDCKACKKTITCNEIKGEGIHEYLKFREYKRLKNSNLAYPNEKFLRLYRDVAEEINTFLDQNCHYKGILQNFKSMFKQNTNLSWLGCESHSRTLSRHAIQLISRMHVHNWCNRINKILTGKIEDRHVSQYGKMSNMALAKFRKFRLRKKKINK